VETHDLVPNSANESFLTEYKKEKFQAESFLFCKKITQSFYFSIPFPRLYKMY